MSGAPERLIVLGIETSCDETAVAVVDGDKRIRADLVLSQLEEHRPYGGVVPEIAARAHLDHLDGLLARAMTDAGLGFADLDAVAATTGPGLIGGLIVGATTGKAIALAHRKPFLAVNHLAAHALTARLTDDARFPYLLLLVSGGHCQLLLVEDVERFRRLGTTIDDAVGECFDKVAKLLGLDYPGGPAVERQASSGDPSRFALPRPMLGRPGCDFSFSGLKTAARHALAGLGRRPEARDIADLCAGLQAAIADVLADRCARALARCRAEGIEPSALVIAGGVAANKSLRSRLGTLAAGEGVPLLAPPARLCTDNAVMVAWAGLERLRRGASDELAVAARPRWPLDPTAPPAIGAGVKA
jgi:N6-L-threonylcarbamoyladenine synthase